MMRKDEAKEKSSSTDPQWEKAALTDVLINHYKLPPRTAVSIVQRASGSAEKNLIKHGSVRSWLMVKLVAKAAQINLGKLRKDLAVELKSHPVADRKKVLFEEIISILPAAYALDDLPTDPEKLKIIYLDAQRAIIHLENFIRDLEIGRTNLIALVPSLPAKRKGIRNALKEGVLLPGTKWKTMRWDPLKKAPVCDLVSLSYYTPSENEALQKIEEVETKIAAVRFVLRDYVEQRQRIRVRANIKNISLGEYLPKAEVSSDKGMTRAPTLLPNSPTSAGATQPPNAKNLHSLDGLDWGEVSISVSDESISIRARGITDVKHFSDFGCRDNRAKTKIKPDKAWATLKVLAQLGEIEWKSKNIEQKLRHGLQKQIQALRKKLQGSTGIKSDPFHPYTKDTGYEAKFSIRLETAISNPQSILNNNETDDSEIKELMESEINRKNHAKTARGQKNFAAGEEED
jgi:hypothetical protein